MEGILRSVSNPFERETFSKIIDIFLKSQDRYDFYENVVTHQKDVEPGVSAEKTSKYIKNRKFPYLQVEESGGWGFYRHFSQVFQPQYRIYINASQNGINSLLDYFISECENDNLPFELKYDINSNTKRNDVIVIGSHSSVLKKHIEILKQFAESNPEIIKGCGSPHLMTGNLDNWLGITSENANRYRSYTQHRIDLIQESIMRYALQNKEMLGLTGNEDIDVFSRKLEDFEERQRDCGKKLDNTIGRTCKIGDEIKQRLIVVISEQPDLIDGIRDVFIKVCAEHGLDSVNPIFNENYQTELEQSGSENNKVLGDDIIELLNQADATHIFNYLTDENADQLNTQSKMKLIKVFVEKDISEKIIELRMIRDVEGLHTLGLISDETFQQFSEIYGDDYADALNESKNNSRVSGCFYGEYLNEGVDDISLISDIFLMKRNEEYFRNGEGMPYVSIGIKEQSQKISERLNNIIAYYSERKMDESAQHQRIFNANRVADSLGDELFFPRNQIDVLNNDAFMLEHIIENREQIEAVSKRICEELNLALTNNRGIANIRQAIMKYNGIETDDVDR